MSVSSIIAAELSTIVRASDWLVALATGTLATSVAKFVRDPKARYELMQEKDRGLQ